MQHPECSAGDETRKSAPKYSWRRWTQNTSDRWVSAVWPVDRWRRYQPVASSSSASVRVRGANFNQSIYWRCETVWQVWTNSWARAMPTRTPRQTKSALTSAQLSDFEHTFWQFWIELLYKLIILLNKPHNFAQFLDTVYIQWHIQHYWYSNAYQQNALILLKVLMNTFIRQKAEETDRQTDKQTNNANAIKQYKRND